MTTSTTQPEMTKERFVLAYKAELLARYDWARNNNERLLRFLDNVRATLDGKNSWNHQGPAVTAAWHRIGGGSVPTLKALRGLRGAA